MKLKNKKTGETGYYLHTHRDYKTGVLKVAVLKDGVPFPEFKPYEPIYDYDSLAELNEEWCDYEEPKEYWYIYADKPQKADCGDILEEDFKAIGNYFVTKEEAEKAVEKLKAWKRLKDKGFRFRGWIREHKKGSADITIASFIDEDYDITNDLDICFGGEE